MTGKKKDNKDDRVKGCKQPFQCWSAKCNSFLGFTLAVAALWLDQMSKWMVLNQMMVSPRTVPVTSFLNIVLVWNRGISFGLLSSGNPYSVWILVTIALIFTAILMLWILRAETKLMATAFGLILGGAVGNVLDRIRFGAVTDFLDFHAHGYHWYTFNIADAAIVGGVALILLGQTKELLQAREAHNKS